MVRPFAFAVQMRAPQNADDVVLAATTAEELGDDGIFSFDHVGMIDPFAPLLVAAAATRTLRVGPLVLNNELHHPALLARTAATVDAMTGGRLVLGLGTGHAKREHDAIGLPLNPPGARVRRLAESLTVLRSLLDTDTATFDGEFHHIAVESLGVRPAQTHVPFLIGGHGPRVVELAGRFADVYQFTGLAHGDGGSPDPTGLALEHLRRRRDWLTEAAGDRDSEIVRSALVQAVSIGPGADGHVDEVAADFEVPPHVVIETPFLLVGTVEQVIDKLQRLRDDLGISHYVVRDAAAFAPIVNALAGC